jgi:hypothetical protein
MNIRPRYFRQHPAIGTLAFLGGIVAVGITDEILRHKKTISQSTITATPAYTATLRNHSNPLLRAYGYAIAEGNNA